jgi:hypothetical protein
MSSLNVITTTPPMITNGEIELFGRKGREIYSVKSINFYPCKDINEECVHDISMLYEDSYGSVYYFDIHNISYDDLVRRNYILYLRGSNNKLIVQCSGENCKLRSLPSVR